LCVGNFGAASSKVTEENFHVVPGRKKRKNNVKEGKKKRGKKREK
jgi:hypothetical protein